MQFIIRDHRNIVLNLSDQLDPSLDSEFISLHSAIEGVYVFGFTVSENALEFPVVVEVVVRNKRGTAEFSRPSAHSKPYLPET